MTLFELSEYFNSFLHIENYRSDPSLNGIQIENSSPKEKPIKKVAFATDACCATALEAARAGADLLFVHHGLFWGDCQTITGTHYARIASFIKNDLALYAAHIPLDANKEVGNNYGLARAAGLENLEPFGEWRGMSIGVKGTFSNPVSLEELGARVLGKGKTFRILDFGKKLIKSVGIISGGAGHDAVQAANEGLDAYVTGEVLHEDFHLIKELGISVIAGGHYQTETMGVQLVQKKLEAEKGLKTVFIDIPTGY